VTFSQQHFQYFSISPDHEKNFRTFGQNYLKQRHFELFPKSGGFYSLRSDPDPGSGTGFGFFSEVGSGSGQNGPDPPTLAVAVQIFAHKQNFKKNIFQQD
jgi:hypothetical protein